MADTILKGKQIRGGSRAPKQVTDRRVCAKKSCTTTLSQYNRREFCFAHAPTKFPRLRGRVVADG